MVDRDRALTMSAKAPRGTYAFTRASLEHRDRLSVLHAIGSVPA